MCHDMELLSAVRDNKKWLHFRGGGGERLKQNSEVDNLINVGPTVRCKKKVCRGLHVRAISKLQSGNGSPVD